MPLMNRTVREESGAWSLLKKAAVRANPTASSSAGTIWPKFPMEVVGAPGVSNTARIFPARSATATTMGAFTDITAFCTTVVTSEMLSGVTGAAGGSERLEDGPPPPQDRHNRTPAQIVAQTAAQTSSESPERPER